MEDKRNFSHDLIIRVLGRVKALAVRGCNIVLPGRCAGCGEMIEAGHGLCATCFNRLDFIADPVCHCCGTPFEIAAAEAEICPVCAASTPSYDHARAALYYNDASRHIILGFKYADRTELCDLFATWLHRAAGSLLQENHEAYSWIIPVPLHRSRLFSRRYNQSALLARALEKTLGIPCLFDGLNRVRKTKVQAGLGRKKRFDNVRGAFVVKNKAKIQGQNILIIDDVLTTGATLSECSRQLKKAGARKVDVLTIARVVQPLSVEE